MEREPDVDEDLHSDDDDGEDPCRIQVELDVLNSASDNINKLETELEKARSKFVKTKAQAGARLNQLLKKVGRRSVKNSQPYYNVQKQLQQAQQEAQKAAARYQDAFSTYSLAKDAVQVAEHQLALEGKSTIPLFNSTCQEILNKATIALYNAEKEKISCEHEHHAKATQCAEYQVQMAQLLKEKAQTIQKAKPFYDLRDSLEMKLKVEKQNAEDLQLALVCNKQKYKLALNNLEQISEEVHARRKSRHDLPPRTPGVGAEAESEFSDLPSSNLDIFSENTSQSSLEIFDDQGVKELCSPNARTHDPTAVMMNEMDRFHHLHLGGPEAENLTVSDTVEKLRREDLLEGAENIDEKNVLEFVAPTSAAFSSSVEVHQERTSVENNDVSSEAFASVKVSEVLKSTLPCQKRSVVVRDLPKGIYVASSTNGSRAAAVNNQKSFFPIASGTTVTDQASTEGQKKKKTILQQFPLLQGLLGSGFQPSTTSQPKF